MQNWQNNGQPVSGAGQGQQDIWADAFSFQDGVGQFQTSQVFPQASHSTSMPNAAVYGHGQVNGRGTPTESGLYHSPHQGQQASLANQNPVTGVAHAGGFYQTHSPGPGLGAGQARYNGLDQTYVQQQTQDQTMQGLESAPQKLYGNTGGLNQGHNQPVSHTSFQYAGQTPSPYSSQFGEYTESQLMPQQTRQQGHLSLHQQPQQASQQQQQQPQHGSQLQQPQHQQQTRAQPQVQTQQPQQQEQAMYQQQQQYQHQQQQQQQQPRFDPISQSFSPPPIQSFHQPAQQHQAQQHQAQQRLQAQQQQHTQQHQAQHQPQHHQSQQPQSLAQQQSHSQFQQQQQQVQQQSQTQQPQLQQSYSTPQASRVFAGSPQAYHAQPASSPPVNTQNLQNYGYHQQAAPLNHPQQQARFMPQQIPYGQPLSAAAFQSAPVRQPTDLTSQQQQALPQPPQQHPQQMSAASPLVPQALAQAATISPAQGQAQSPVNLVDTTQSEQPAKKRKKMTKNPEVEPVEFVYQAVANSTGVRTKPTSTDEETAKLMQFKKRTAAAKKAFPAISGAPFLSSPGPVRLPTPKSYDRLAPLVAPPSQSGRPILPDLGYPLPCEIQGRFSDKYKPSVNFSGKPEDREKEAKPLIEEYQREMKALGIRRPKYADYPVTFQEQLKADEAAKTKAQRKARKEEEEERKKPIRPPTRPVDPVEGAVWDFLGIVYIDPAANRTNSLIASAVQSTGEFFIKLRGEMSKLKQEIDQAAKEKRSGMQIDEAKKRYELKKDIVMKACEAADKHGDDAVLENLGGHQKGVLSLVNLLIGCIKAVDYSGRMPKAILGFMSNISMTKKIAEGVNFETVRKRFADKGDDEVKELVKSVASRIRKESDMTQNGDVKKSTSTYTGSAATASSASTAAAFASRATKSGVAAAKAGSGASPTKRPLEDEADSRPGKKINIDGTSSSLSNKLGSTKTTPGSTLQAKLSTPKIRPPSSSLAAKNRPLIKPGASSETAKSVEPVKSETPSSSSTAMDVDSRAPPKPEPKKVKPEAKPAPAPRTTSGGGSLSSIASLLDSINTPKPDQLLQKGSGKAQASETPEEKTKRLRKEARRKLRVTWKPEADLVQVRIFHKEAAEDEDNMTRDAADDRSEGMMLKQRGQFTEEEDDEDDDLPDRPWVAPVLADLSRIPEEYRAKAFVTRGGAQTFDTPEQKAMAEREQTELMAVYALVSDIPPTPNSPGPEPSIPEADAKVAHLPRDGAKYEEIHRRWQEAQTQGIEAALYYATKRLDALNDPAAKLQSLLNNFQQPPPTETAPEGYNYNMTPPQQHAQPHVTGGPRVAVPPAVSWASLGEHVLRLLTSEKIKAWNDPDPYNPAAPKTQRRNDYPDPVLQAQINALEELLEQLKGLPYPASQPPAWLASDAERVREWWAGYQKDVSARAKREAEDQARLGAAATANAQQQQQQQPNQGQGQDHAEAWAAYYQQQQQYAQYMAMLQQAEASQADQQQAVQEPLPEAAPAQSSGSTIADQQLQALLNQINQPQQSQVPATIHQQGSRFQAQAQAQAQAQDQAYQQQGRGASSGRPNSHYEDNGGLDYDDDYGLDYGEEDRSHDYGSNGRDWDEDSGNRHDRDDKENRRDKHSSKQQQQQQRKGNAPGGPTLAPHRPANKALIGTKPCVFWQQGKCARGDKCTFRHDD